ncbi:hypothetical protein ACFFUS_10475 [Vibrio gallaecicus]|nr:MULTISPECIES: hypothetical protein [Vibrio]MDN3616776.1 hypothetical protein [Vibrio gallaecicus]
MAGFSYLIDALGNMISSDIQAEQNRISSSSISPIDKAWLTEGADARG